MFFLAVALGAQGAPARAQGSSMEVARKSGAADAIAMTVGDREITVSELCGAIAMLPPPQAKGYPLHPRLAAQWYGPLVAFAEEAKREHLAASLPPGTEDNLLDEENGLSEALIQKMARDIQPSGVQIEAYYESHASEFERTRARHILISDAGALASRSPRTAAEAKARAEEIAAELGRGADFATLAEKDSEDPYSREKGGDLGEVSHHQMEPAVDKVLWSLAPGRTSPPFEGRFGYEIVRVEGRRVLSLEEARATIIGDLKFQGSMRRQEQIINAAHISLKRVFMKSALPCDAKQAALQPKPQPR
jgi:hypothetical protein